MLKLITRKNDEFYKLPSLFFNDLFESDFLPSPTFPKINTRENDESYNIDVYYPGVEKNDFKIKMEKDTISISVENVDEKQEKNKSYIIKEYFKKQFKREFSMPEKIIKEKINAKYKDGVLKIEIPKDKTKEKESNIEISID